MAQFLKNYINSQETKTYIIINLFIAKTGLYNPKNVYKDINIDIFVKNMNNWI